jgi:hypothetical protein
MKKTYKKHIKNFKRNSTYKKRNKRFSNKFRGGDFKKELGKGVFKVLKESGKTYTENKAKNYIKNKVNSYEHNKYDNTDIQLNNNSNKENQFNYYIPKYNSSNTNYNMTKYNYPYNNIEK